MKEFISNLGVIPSASGPMTLKPFEVRMPVMQPLKSNFPERTREEGEEDEKR
jgi:hypothetical protein